MSLLERISGPEDLLAAYESLVGALLDATALAGFCYTQLTDTEQETNGLLTSDRTPKLDPDKVREIIAQTEIRVSATGEVLRLQRMRYRGGVVSYLEVLDAERQFFDAEIELARAKLDQLRAYVELYRALGGGWSDQEIRQVIDAARSK